MSQPFLLLTPLGRLDPKVARTFRENGVAPSEVRLMVDYPRLSTALYARTSPTAERARIQLAYEETWRARVSDVSAELWLLDAAAFEVAWEIKPRLRVEWPAETVPFESRVLLLRTFHLPDREDVAREWGVVTAHGAR